MVGFAGFPLVVEDRLLGVMAMFSQRPFPDNVLDALGTVANSIALGIERSRTEAERDELLRRLTMQVERMPLAYLLLDRENRVQDWNPCAEEMFGYTKREMMGRNPFDDIVAESARDKARDVLERLLSGDMTAHSVNENRTKDGRIITCEWLNTPFFGPDGKVSGIFALARDVTERQRLLDKVRQAQQRLESVVTSSPAVLYTLEGADARSLVLTWISGNVQEMMGYTLEQVMRPEWWQERVHADDLARVFAEIAGELLTRGRLAQEYRFLHRSGEYRWVRSEMRRLSGGPIEVVGSWSDITERKKLEEQFRQAQKMEAIGQLAGGVAHDFNNLLTVISGYSEILLGSSGIEEGKKGLIREIGKAGERAASLTRQLLAFSRKQILEPRALDLNALIRDEEKMLRRLIGEDVTLATALDPALKRVKADPGQLEQVIMNLVVNARDAMPQGGRLTIETKSADLDGEYAKTHPRISAGRYVMLAVSDSGVGMTPEVKARIFEPFFTTKGMGKGTGLGLATVYGIVEQSGGHIDVYSEPGHGTSFKIFLPPVEEQRPSERPANGAMAMPEGSETILVVEDEDAVRAIALHSLQSCGYNVLEASDGKQALQRCEKHPGRIDLIVTDVVMPEMPGRLFVEHLAKTRPETKVLYMSGYTDDAVIRHGILQADTAFLQKPFTPQGLAKKVREVLDHLEGSGPKRR
jgi:PAS domain S-box-containing protein